MPLSVRGALAGLIETRTPEQWNEWLRPLPAGVKGLLAGERLHLLARKLPVRSGSDLYTQVVSHWKDPSAVVINGREPGRERSALSQDLLSDMMLTDALNYLPTDILTKVDRAAMAVSLETRIPLLDHRVVELAWRLPPALKVRAGQGKWPLCQVLQRYVPPALFERKKMGFGVPIDAWLRGPLRDWGEALLDTGRLHREGYFDPAPIRRLWDQHQRGDGQWHYYLWDILMFQAWLEQSAEPLVADR